MALKAKGNFSFTGSGSTVGMQAIEPITLADQTISALTGGIQANCRGIYVTTAGTLTLQTVGNTDTKTVSFAAGIYPLEITAVFAAGSASLVGWFYF